MSKVTTLLKVACLAAMAGLAIPASSDSKSDHEGVMVFTSKNLPQITSATHANRVFFLDGAHSALQGLRFPNPGNRDKAIAMASDVLQTEEGREAIETISQTGEGVALAWQHGIRKLPAILVGGTHVVYGVFDVQSALEIIHRRTGYVR